MAKKSWIVKANTAGQVRSPARQPLQALRPQPRLHAQVRRLPDLLPRAGLEGQAARRDEVELVSRSESDRARSRRRRSA